MNILIPIAGFNVKLEDSPYIKSLYEIEKKIVLQHIYESLNVIENAQFIVVIKREDIKKFHIDDTLRLLIPNVKIVVSEEATQGSACSCLLAIDYIDSNESLLISGGDQLITVDWEKIIEEFQAKNYDGGAVCFDAVHPKWSYVRLNKDGLVIEAAEKRPISRNATTGQYYFKHGSDFIYSAEQMVKKGADVDGQFYVCPVFNEMVLQQKVIGVYQISQDDYFSLRDQRGMNEYEEYLRARRS